MLSPCASVCERVSQYVFNLRILKHSTALNTLMFLLSLTTQWIELFLSIIFLVLFKY